MDDFHEFFHAPTTIRKPILNNSKETAILLNHHFRQSRVEDIDPLVNRMDRIAALVKAASSYPETPTATSTRRALPRTMGVANSYASGTKKFESLLRAAKNQKLAEEKAESEIDQYSKQLFSKQKADAALLLSLIQREQAQSEIILQRERRVKEHILEQERLEQDQRDSEEKDRRRKEEQAQEAHRVELERQEEEKRMKQQAKEEGEARIKAALAKKTEHIAKAKKMVQKLDQVRESIHLFETSKERAISRRRLKMKKVAGGKMSTLSREKEKVDTVAKVVIDALEQSYQEDVALKQQMQSDPSITREMTRGCRYLMDLIASTVVKRVQADGFNGYVGCYREDWLLFPYFIFIFVQRSISSFVFKNTCLELEGTVSPWLICLSKQQNKQQTTSHFC